MVASSILGTLTAKIGEMIQLCYPTAQHEIIYPRIVLKSTPYLHKCLEAIYKLYIAMFSFIIFFTVHMNFYDFAQMFNFYFRARNARPFVLVDFPAPHKVSQHSSLTFFNPLETRPITSIIPYLSHKNHDVTNNSLHDW